MTLHSNCIATSLNQSYIIPMSSAFPWENNIVNFALSCRTKKACIVKFFPVLSGKKLGEFVYEAGLGG